MTDGPRTSAKWPGRPNLHFTLNLEHADDQLTTNLCGIIRNGDWKGEQGRQLTASDDNCMVSLT